jgi:hypothetical protein
MTSVNKKAEFGLNGGVYLNGDESAVATSSLGFNVGYVYYPISASQANIKMSNITNGSEIIYTGSTPVYGPITEVTQSAGQAFIYFGSPDYIVPPKQVS